MQCNLRSPVNLYRKFIHRYFRIYQERDYYKILSDKYNKFNPPGHYYSPIPSEKDIPDSILIDYNLSIPGIDLKPESQLALLEELKQYYNKSIFPSEKKKDFRYYFN